MNYSNLKSFAGKISVFSFVFILFISAGVMAQVPMQQGQQQQQVNTDFSEEELEGFVEVYVKASEIQQQNETVMMQAIEEEDLELQRFNEILTSRQQQQSAEEINASAEELAAFNKAAEKIMTVQQEAQTEINELIEEEIGAEKYQQIAMAYQQSPDVQQKINEMLQNKMQ
jgi:hypothetical protein